ncbi:MAG: bifunctional diaminohydroxyphosphoribosylaminopyrimidine deaminase/5-amino-6-(5-phosphoribosylamino)uracil reductase RibD, partial [Rhodobacterales bacterium]|nr:bifunctional diaminohydroxyphosphoribosylaminopyrimidine deaminase/5-amino-6-(5-phosphoribosylamino)uracil reductase RibD [Rhodobacterales bacterium]
MAHALALAARGLGRVWPNPAVGCVLVAQGRVVGRGWTQPAGRPHAETVALAQAGDLARGATAHVTLEPCAHHGQTPPCALALVQAGVARVVTALTDPDPRVSGRGHAMLRAAGLAVTEGVLAAEARALQQGFLTRVTRGRPMVTLKLATSLDGRIATATGESRWITGPLARRAVHALRMRHDAVLVGAGTALADDPDLTVRDLGSPHQPIRLVLDSRLRLPVDSRLGRSAGAVPVWLLHGPAAPDAARAAWAAAGARLIEVPAPD